MRLTRYLKPPQVRLELETVMPEEKPEEWSESRFLWSVKSAILQELVGLLDASGKVSNPKRLFHDLENRERKATTGIGGGIAIPHVRTMQAKDFTICFARCTPGIYFNSLDGEPVHFFFGVVAPPYRDKLYLEVYKKVGQVFGTEDAREALLAAADEHEVIRIVSAFDE